MERVNRVIYEKNPLIEVILQLKFPTILSINSVEPAEFQEAIRDEYPIYHLNIENEQPLEIVANDKSLFSSIKQTAQHKNHTFISSNGEYKINLTSSFLSISTVRYTRWEDMLSKLENPLKKFIEIYKPPFFDRIGLRYIDAFSKEKLNLSDKKWSDLINPIWLGVLTNVDENKVLHLGIDTEYLLDDDVSTAKIHTGLGFLSNEKNIPEKVFIVDSDFIHINNVEISECYNIFNYLHENAGNFIRSAIQEDLHIAMNPGEL